MAIILMWLAVFCFIGFIMGLFGVLVPGPQWWRTTRKRAAQVMAGSCATFILTRIIEWRMVDENGLGPYQFPSRFLTGVIFGCRMSEEHKKLIRDWCKNRQPAITYYEAKQSEDSYSLNIVEIS